MSEDNEESCRRRGRSGDHEPSDERRAAAWLDENKAAIASSNAYVEAYGLPLAQFRQF